MIALARLDIETDRPDIDMLENHFRRKMEQEIKTANPDQSAGKLTWAFGIVKKRIEAEAGNET